MVSSRSSRSRASHASFTRCTGRCRVTARSARTPTPHGPPRTRPRRAASLLVVDRAEPGRHLVEAHPAGDGSSVPPAVAVVGGLACRGSNTSWGNDASSCLVSCMQRTSGHAYRSHSSTAEGADRVDVPGRGCRIHDPRSCSGPIPCRRGRRGAPPHTRAHRRSPPRSSARPAGHPPESDSQLEEVAGNDLPAEPPRSIPPKSGSFAA